jgi:hypothetical protein
VLRWHGGGGDGGGGGGRFQHRRHSAIRTRDCVRHWRHHAKQSENKQE